MCAQTPLSTLSRASLEVFADSLGIPYIEGGDICSTLAVALGDVWEAVQESTQREAARRSRALATIRSLRGGQERHPPTAIPQAPAVGVVGELPPTTIWQRLPPEIRLVVIERLADDSPRTVLALYETDSEARDMIDRLRHGVYTVDDNGMLTETAIPLLAYARIATALGETDPLRLFLASALCTLKALADVEVNASTGLYQQFPQAIAQGQKGVTPVARNGIDSFSSLISGNVPLLVSTVVSDKVTNLVAAAQDRGIDVAQMLSGPLPGNLSDIVRQWYEWTTGPIDALIERDGLARTVLGFRYQASLGWNPYTVSPKYDYAIYAVVNALHPIYVGPDEVADADPTNYRLRVLGGYDWDDVYAAFAGIVPFDVFQGWCVFGEAEDTARLLQEAATQHQRTVSGRLARMIGAHVNGAMSPGPCSALADRHTQLAPFDALFHSQSRFWLLPEGVTVSIVADLESPAIEQAIAMASA